MSDRLHEIIAEIGSFHNKFVKDGTINNAQDVFNAIEHHDTDIQEHYLNLLLQYYFQENDLTNLKEVLLTGAKFDMRFSDVKDAFLNIKSNDENVIEFMNESIVFIKDSNLDNALRQMHTYYTSNPELQVYLEEAVEVIKRNRYVCAHCYKTLHKEESQFFLNEDLLESLKRDLPYLLS